MEQYNKEEETIMIYHRRSAFSSTIGCMNHVKMLNRTKISIVYPSDFVVCMAFVKSKMKNSKNKRFLEKFS